MHVDAAYAGTAFLCPEFRHFMDWHRVRSFPGLQSVKMDDVSSKGYRPYYSKDGSPKCQSWVKNSGSLHRTFNVDPIYLQHENTGMNYPPILYLDLPEQ
ncbi:hypothetical protein SK128_016941 [Halocaridina rubra]|uniref:Histidine decarboxylase n=1 Tax=Halocaridina rubra TaxID=373956 RepID=A0AAN8XF89_HALRR